MQSRYRKEKGERKEKENIDLLRKTSLFVLPEDILNAMFSDLKTDEMKQVNLIVLITKIATCKGKALKIEQNVIRQVF